MNPLSELGYGVYSHLKDPSQPWKIDINQPLTPNYTHIQESSKNDISKTNASVLTPSPDHFDDHEYINEDELEPEITRDSPHVVSFDEVCSAANRIKSFVAHSACFKSKLFDLMEMELFYKMESNQYTGSSKDRGACHVMMMLTEEQKKKGIVSASFGNHSMALSYYGNLFEVPVTVVLPISTSMTKINYCRKFKANVVVKGKDLREAKKIAQNIAQTQGILYINGYDHPHIIAAQGSIGLEILDQVPGVDAIIVPVGGGGHLAGIATAVKGLKPLVKVIGVESERCPSFAASLKNGSPVKSKMSDGSNGVEVGYNCLVTAAPLVDKLVAVSESSICSAMHHIAEREKVIVEGMAAAGVAAILMGHLSELKNKTVVCIFTGSNIDTCILGKCFELALALENRLLKVQLTVTEKGGGIMFLCKTLTANGAAIKDIIYDRAWIKGDVFSCDVSLLIEVQNDEHASKIMQKLTKHYQNVTFPEISLPCVLGPHGAEEEES